MKKVSGLVLMTILILGSIVNVFAQNDIEIYLDGSAVQTDVVPKIIDGRTLVPIRVISENLGYDVAWDGSSKTINIQNKNGNSPLKFQVGSKDVFIGESDSKILDVAPIIVDNRTLVPIRFIAENFGMDVDWNGETRRININSDKAEDYIVQDIHIEVLNEIEPINQNISIDLPVFFNKEEVKEINIENDSNSKNEKQQTKTVPLELILGSRHIFYNGNENKSIETLTFSEREEMLERGRELLGTPYIYGGKDIEGFDCSGLMFYLYMEQGVELDRTSRIQIYDGKIISIEELEIGDLVFYGNAEHGIDHVGMFSGNGNLLHSSHSKGVVEEKMSYLESRYIGAIKVDRNNKIHHFKNFFMSDI